MGTHGNFHQPGVPAGGAWLLNNHPALLLSSGERRINNTFKMRILKIIIMSLMSLIITTEE